MKSSVVIKGCKSGMTVILNPDTPFEQLLEDVGKKPPATMPLPPA